MNINKFYYKVFNNSEQVMHHLIDLNDRLHTIILSPTMPLAQNSCKRIEVFFCGLVKSPKSITFVQVKHSISNSLAHR